MIIENVWCFHCGNIFFAERTKDEIIFDILSINNFLFFFY